MAIEGRLGDTRLPEVLQAVAAQRRTGILTLQSETTIVAVSFLAGHVVSADSLAHTVEERLGEGLVAEGLVERATIAALTRRQDAGDGRLTELLVADGVLSRAGVLDALRRQNVALLRELLGWSEGDFKFYGGDEVAYEEGIEPISIDGLLSSTLDDRQGDGDEGGGADEAAFAAPGAPVAAAPGPFASTREVPTPGAAGAEDDDLAPAAAAGGTWAGEAPPAAVEPPEAAPAAAAVPKAGPAGRPVRRTPRRVAAEETAAPAPDPAARGMHAGLGLILVAVLVAAVLAVPTRLLLPFPWQAGDRQALAEVQRLADRFAIDRAAKTFFLLEGHFPPSLAPLVRAGLLDGEQRVGPEGGRLSFVAHEESYDILAAGEEQPVWSEAITGNFLLDPDLRLAAAAPAGEERPLVLLD
jgi:hypothetical protein